MKTNIIKRANAFVMALVLTLSALAVWTPGKALAATRTWDGGGGDNKWSTAANWSDNTAPVNGDIIAFDLTVPEDFEEIENDIENLSVAGITLTGAGAGNQAFTLTGNALTLTGNISGTPESGRIYIELDITLGADVSITTNAAAFSFGCGAGSCVAFSELDLSTHKLSINTGPEACSGVRLPGLKGSGALEVVSSFVDLQVAKDGYSGNVTVSAGGLAYTPTALGANNTITVNGTSELRLVASENATFTTPIVMNSAGNPALVAGPYMFRCIGGAPAPAKTTTTLSGSLTLSRNTIFSGANDLKVTGTYTKNGHTLSVKDGSAGTITTSEGTLEGKPIVTTYEGDKSDQNPNVTGGSIAIIAQGATVGNVFVDGGTLKGVGKTGNIEMYSGIVAPGLSPGCLSSGNLSYNGGAVEIEIHGETVCTQYDQQNVTGTVNLGAGVTTLTIQRLASYKPKVGQQFVIIANDAADAITGTFAGLAQGATVSVDGVTYGISYTGGDGNDVVLTVIGGPNTGFLRYVMANPLLVLITALLTAGAVYFLANRHLPRRTTA